MFGLFSLAKCRPVATDRLPSYPGYSSSISAVDAAKPAIDRKLIALDAAGAQDAGHVKPPLRRRPIQVLEREGARL